MVLFEFNLEKQGQLAFSAFLTLSYVKLCTITKIL